MIFLQRPFNKMSIGKDPFDCQVKGTTLCSRRETGAATALAPPPPFVPNPLAPIFPKSGANLIPSNRHRSEHPQIFFKIPLDLI